MNRRNHWYLFSSLALLAMGASAASRPLLTPSNVAITTANAILNPTAEKEDHTEALELHFAPASADLPRDQESALNSFLRGLGNKGRLHDLKVIVYSPDSAKATNAERQLARDRLDTIRNALVGEASTTITYQIFPERAVSEGAPQERGTADLLAVME